MMEKGKCRKLAIQVFFIIIIIFPLRIFADSYTENWGNSWPHYSKGIELASEGKFEEAEEQFEQALKIHEFEYNSEEQLRVINDLRNNIINEEYVLSLFKGMNIEKTQIAPNPDKKIVQQAIRYYQKCVKINPNYPTSYLNLGTAYFKIGQYQKMLDSFEKALQLNTDNILVYSGLGMAYGTLRQNKKAREMFLKAKKLFQERGDTFRAEGMDRTIELLK